MGYAAATWAFLFAALSLYWAAGGDAGLGTLAEGIREPALARDPSFVAILWATVVLKVLAGLLALALCRRWARSIPRWMLLLAGWGAGMLLSLYGGIGLTTAGLAEFGITESADPATTRWYLLLWEPIWFLGGVLFIIAASHFGRDRTDSAAPLPSVRQRVCE